MGDPQTRATEFDHLFEYKTVETRKLAASLSITLVTMFFEIVGGLLTNSIALLSDASHMFTHAFAICISLVAIAIARKPACHHKTFGLYRAEVLAAFVNGMFLLPIIGFIVYEAVMRLLNPIQVLGSDMLVVAVIGLAVNIASIILLHGNHENDLNVKSVFYHMIADAMSSVGIVIVAIVIQLTNWSVLDPLVSLGISVVILHWAWGILKESARVLLEMAPKSLNVDIVDGDLKERFKSIVKVYNSHLWTITPRMLIFSTHVQVSSPSNDGLIRDIHEYLSSKYKIQESTIQVVTDTEAVPCSNPFY